MLMGEGLGCNPGLEFLKMGGEDGVCSREWVCFCSASRDVRDVDGR